jgi:hypothetical protein
MQCKICDEVDSHEEVEVEETCDEAVEVIDDDSLEEDNI